ncbi:uncharacterized protein LOC143915087 [Arctopsyche grandis]|uniref:uncharacterized protein LOC143915087 n=1 Tax=Arctopsyche grandis TaxID=121162 RepID=UPI00406D89E1
MDWMSRECQRAWNETRRLYQSLRLPELSRLSGGFRLPEVPHLNGVPPLSLSAVPPISSRSLYRTYGPITGMVAHQLLAVNVMHPPVITRLIPKRDITNALLLMSFTGASLWLWRRPHIAGTLPSRRFPWVFLGSSMYVLGSVLMWAIIRSAIGRHPVICITLGLTSSTALTYSAIDYFKYLDKDFEPLEDVTDGTHNSDEEKYDLDI